MQLNGKIFITYLKILVAHLFITRSKNKVGGSTFFNFFWIYVFPHFKSPSPCCIFTEYIRYSSKRTPNLNPIPQCSICVDYLPF